MAKIRTKLLLFSLAIALLCCTTSAETISQLIHKRQTENPYRNLHMSPFGKWISAYECMQNTSTHCKTQDKDIITLNGVLNISASEISDFCEGGCKDHTKDVLTCISYVYPDFWFANKAPLHNITAIIDNACANNLAINTTTYDNKNSGTRAFQNFLVPLVTSLATASVVAIFNI